MKLIFLSAKAPHHYYLINKINEHHPVSKVFFETILKEKKRDSIWKDRLERFINPKTTMSIIRNFMLRFLYAKETVHREEHERKMFFGNTPQELDLGIPSEVVYSLNEREALDKIKQENPDLIIVYGTQVLKGEILDVAKLNILNIHSDIVPKYRGSGFPFWIFYNKDFENLGVTVHICAKNLDAGDIVGQKYYQLAKSDRIYTLRSRTVKLAIEIVTEVIDTYKNGTVVFRKQEKSKLWSSKDLTLFKHIVARKNFDDYINSL